MLFTTALLKKVAEAKCCQIFIPNSIKRYSNTKAKD